MDLSVVPDLTMRGQDDPHARVIALRPATVGQLAARVRALAGRPGEWWRLVRFDPDAPVHVPLDGEIWLTTWPPGHGRTIRAQVSTLIAGELAEVVITARGVTERPLRANRVRVHGGAHGVPGGVPGGEEPYEGSPELTNPGPAFAVSLHAAAARPSGLPPR
ncbi:cysteine dioxygenase [Spirillospora sp. NPDC049024]